MCFKVKYCYEVAPHLVISNILKMESKAESRKETYIEEICTCTLMILSHAYAQVLNITVPHINFNYMNKITI